MIAQYRQAVEQHRQRIYSFAYYSLRTREDAEDITQEVFIKLWQHWRKIDHGKLGSWLSRVAHNAIIDHVRKNRHAGLKKDDYAEVDEQPVASDEGERLDRDAFKKTVVKAIRELPDPFRSIMVMRDLQGLSYAEIRESLRISESQVKVYLHRARRKLRDNPALRTLFNELGKTL